MARWSVSEVTSIPKVWDTESGDPAWYPLQHALGIDTFGVNVFVATSADQLLVEEHDERASGQQELYLVLEGQTIFELDGEELRWIAARFLRSPIRPSDAPPEPWTQARRF